jgi:hypothetical protein
MIWAILYLYLLVSLGFSFFIVMFCTTCLLIEYFGVFSEKEKRK